MVKRCVVVVVAASVATVARDAGLVVLDVKAKVEAVVEVTVRVTVELLQ